MKVSNIRFRDTTAYGDGRYIVRLGVKIEMSDGRIFYAEEATTKDVIDLVQGLYEKFEESDLDSIMRTYVTYDEDDIEEYENDIFITYLQFEGTYEEYMN